MQSLKPSEVKAIEQFFQLRQNSLKKVMFHFLQSNYETIYNTKDYIVAVGDIPVALVAHLDTVFSTPPTNVFYDRVKNVMWSPEGLGADDRAGVYAIVQIIKQGLRPSIIFTTEEEKGAIGASELVKAFPQAPMELKYIIELDRRGSNDCVFYDCDNPEFEEYVEEFGFITAFGSFSDISVICPKWEIAGVNLSIGYEDEHSYSELLYVGRMQATIKKVVKMLQSINDKTPKFDYIPMDYNQYINKLCSGYGWGDPYDFEYVSKCSNCGTRDFDYNLFHIKNDSNKPVFLCAECISKDPNVGWCINCGEPFLAHPDDKLKRYCSDCQEGKGDIKVNGLFKN